MARKKKTEKERDPAAGLLVMMVSLNLILLIFFIFLNSIGADDGQKIKKALGSLAGTFGMLPGGLSVEAGTKLMLPGAPMVSPEYSSTHIGEEFTRIIREKKIGKTVRVTKEGKNLVINLPEKTLFSSGSAELRGDSDDLLEAVGYTIQKYRFPVRIEGHTDDLPIHTPEFPSNWELSAARATAVLRHLSEKEKIAMERLTAVGYGEFNPLLPNDRPENRKRNRRVRIVLVNLEG